MTIHWIESLHSGDEGDYIQQCAEVGGDEGPILLLPCRYRASGPVFKAKGQYPAQLFENILHVIAHLIEYRDELNEEFWLGIYRGGYSARSLEATAAMWQYKELLNDLSGASKRRPMPTKAKVEAEKYRAMTYSSIEECPDAECDMLLTNEGEAFGDIVGRWKDLPGTLLISRR